MTLSYLENMAEKCKQVRLMLHNLDYEKIPQFQQTISLAKHPFFLSLLPDIISKNLELKQFSRGWNLNPQSGGDVTRESLFLLIIVYQGFHPISCVFSCRKV